MSTGLSFGPLPRSTPGDLTADDFTRLLMQRAPGLLQGFGLGGPEQAPASPPSMPGFSLGPMPQSSVPQPTVALPEQSVSPEPQPMTAPLPPPRPLSFGPLPGPAPNIIPQADMPAADAVPAQGRAVPPLTFGSTPTTSTPAPMSSAPAPAPAPVAGDEGGGFLSNLSRPSVYNTLLGIGSALMTTKGVGNALATGIGNASKLNTQQAATDLAQAEYGLKAGKLQREALANNVTFKSLVARGHAPETVQLAVSAAQAGHGDALNNLLQTAVPKPQEVPFGWVKQPDGSFAPAAGGPQDVNTIRAQNNAREATPAQLEERAAATARGTAAGKPDEPFNLGEGVTRYNADGTVMVAGQAKKPDGFDVETKLRNEFAKGLGTFNDVHEGYGRIIAATRQRETNPTAVSPASDMSLVFGFMKMLDPTSVVREGEYATAKNATGVPDQVRNAYNKAMNGEFLTPQQRQDFLGQASELYGTARKGAEGVAGRYRGLAGQYGVDPGRSVYLPEMPTPPNVGRSRSGSAPLQILDIGGSRDAGDGITIKRVR